jgi:hypothetical protein
MSRSRVLEPGHDLAHDRLGRFLDRENEDPGSRRRLLEDFCKGLGRVLVGAEALALTAGGPPGRLQVVSAEPLERERP